MNYLLSLNKKYVLIFTILSLIIFSIFFIYKFYFKIEYEFINETIEVSNADITNPKFAINNPSQKIFVTAKEGNFIEDGKILLKNNVKFKSNNFSIESDNVIFDRNGQTAHSKDESLFKSDKTTIISEGFDIYDNGNKISFYGNAVVILK